MVPMFSKFGHSSYITLNHFVQYGCAGLSDLQKVNLRIFSHEDCLAVYGDGPTTDMVCSGIPEDAKGVCSVSMMTVPD
jgi:hypothetical protein